MSEAINRRVFLKLGALSVSGASLFPKTWAGLVSAGKARSEIHDPVSPQFRFIGRSLETIKEDVVILPDRFNPVAIQTPIHFVASERGGHIKLIPGNTSLLRSLEEDLKNQAKLTGKDVYVYLGQETIEESGAIHIPTRIQTYSGVHNGEVIIAGILSMIEIWDTASWDAAYQKAWQSMATGSSSDND
jgi:hypothetical protein